MDDAAEEYLHVDNLRRLIAIFGEYMRSRYQTNVDSFSLKEMFLRAMTALSETPAARSMTLQELNKHTLHAVSTELRAQLRAAPSPPPRVPPPPVADDAPVDVDRALQREISHREGFMDRRMQDTAELHKPDPTLAAATPAGNTSAAAGGGLASGGGGGHNSDPVSMLRKNLRMDLENFEASVAAQPDPYFSLQTALPFHPSQLKHTFLTIHSADRNWVKFPNRFEYLVRFTFGEPTVRKVPIFENNPTVPFTRTVNTSGLPNRMGFYLENLTRYPPYDASRPPGAVVGYEDVTEVVDNNAHVHSQITNIVCVRISAAVVPMAAPAEIPRTAAGAAPAPHEFHGMPYPYVQLSIDELPQVYDGTNETARRAFCQLTYKSHFHTASGRGYVRLEPAQAEFKLFVPTFLSGLPSLTIRMTTPYGDLLASDEDGIAVRKLEYTEYHSFYVKVVLAKFFDGHAFRAGDRVRFSNYAMYKAFPEQNTAHVDSLNAFVNRDSGHEVAEIGEANEAGYFNSFYVRAPGALNRDFGRYEVDQCLLKQIVVFNDRFFADVPPDAGADDPAFAPNGTVMNLSMQNVVLMRIDSASQDSREIVSEPVRFGA